MSPTSPAPRWVAGDAPDPSRSAPAPAASPSPLSPPDEGAADGPASASGIAAGRTDGMAIAGMVCGIVGLVTGPLISILGVVFSSLAFSRLREDPGRKGRGFAIAGLVTGIIGTITGLLFVTYFLREGGA